MWQIVCKIDLVPGMHKSPEIVVLAGGIGKRFRQFDSGSPEKPLIRVHGATQIVWALLGIAHSYPSSRIYLASRTGLIDTLRTEVGNVLPGLLTEIVDIGETTLGAAHSLKLFVENSKKLNKNLQLISCDNDCLSLISGPKAPNFVSAMESTNPGHCFVSTDRHGLVNSLHEKSVVGSLALSGNYGFESSEMYSQLYKSTVFDSQEFFLSKVITHAITNLVEFRVVKCDAYFSLGTPEEIQNVDSSILEFKELKRKVTG